MYKKIMLLTMLAFTLTSVAQSKKISLEESVMQQGRKFGADRLSGFQWMPNTNKYVYYTDGWSRMMTANTSNNKVEELTSVNQINNVLGTKLRHLFGTKWENDNTIIVNDGAKFYTFNTTSKTGKLLLEVPENVENTTLSPSNKEIAFTQENNLFYTNSTNKLIAVTENKDKNIVSGQTISRSEFGISGGIFWSPNCNLIAYYQKDETNVADYPLLDSNETPGKLVSIKYPMIGQPSEHVRVGIYNISTRKTIFISPKSGKLEDYMTNLSWTPDSKLVIIAELNREQNEMSLNVYDANSGAFIKTILTEKNSKWVEPEHAAFFPNKNKNNFVWFSEKNGFQNLYYYSIDGKLIKQLTNNSFPAREIIGTNNSGTEIYFSATGNNPTNMLAYKVDLNGKQKVITPDNGVHNLVASSDGNFFFDEYSNHSVPSKSILLNKKLLVQSVLLESKNKFEGYEIGTSEIKTIKAADGTTDLYTRLIKPSNFDSTKKYPVLVYVYGGPHAQLITNSYLDGANLWMFWLAEQGYLVYTIDNRGSDNRGFAFESVIHQKLGENEMEDQIKGVDYLKTLPYVDSNRLAIHGWSFGGFMTVSMMLRKPDVFKVGVAGGPVTDWKYYEIMYGERYMDTPTENKKGFDDNSTLNYVKNLQGKLLLIHGTSDDVVVMQNNMALIKKFIEEDVQVDFFPYPMHKHNVTGKDRVHLMAKVLDYIINNNK